MKRAELAVQYKHSGCNCCQAVLMSYADVLDLDEDTLKAMGAGFGTGMGCTEGNCGALIGAVIADGLRQNRRTPSGARSILAQFRESCGAITCKELKGLTTGKMLCSCDDCIRHAVNVAEDLS